jgi:hypothetical protein
MNDEGINSPQRPGTGSQVYNIVTDIATGPNSRRKDNVYQAIAIFTCLLVGALVGFFVAVDRAFGATVGGFAGLLFGLFASGIFLMFFRALRHLRGKHD